MRTIKLRYLLNKLKKVEHIFKINYEHLRDYPAVILSKIAQSFSLNMVTEIPVTPDFDARVYNHERKIVVYKKSYRKMNFETCRF